MKTKLSKRLLSALLAVMMVVTSIPLMAFTAFADDTDAVKNAMTAYEAKMDGTVYTNMLPAYNAYVDAQEALDAYNYGDASASVLTAAANALTAKTNAMQPWTASKANATITMTNDTVAVPSEYATNILYATAPALTGTTNSGDVKITGALSNRAVFLYDGTEIRMPVMVTWHNDKGIAISSDRKFYTWYPTDNASNSQTDNAMFQLKQQWTGYYSIKENKNTTGNNSIIWNNAMNGSSSKDTFGGYNAATKLANDGDTDIMKANNGYTWWSYANYLTYIGGDGSFSNGLKSTTIGWYGFTGNTSSKNTGNHYLTDTATYYVIDYKTALDAIESNKSKLAGSVSDYKEGGFASVLSAFDQVTIDPNAYDYASNTAGLATSVAKQLSDGAAALGTAVKTSDGDGYRELRTAIDATKAIRNADSSEYTPESWEAFANAFDAAKDVFVNIQSTSYNSYSNAKQLADALNIAFLALKSSTQRVDTTALMTEINTYYLYKNIFTAESDAAVKAAVSAAVIAVWASTENYGNPAKALVLNDANQEIYNQQLANVQNAIKGLRFSMDTTVDLSDGTKASINDMIKLLNELNPDDYSEFGNFRKAVEDAETYAARHQTTDFYNYNEQLAEYTSYVQKAYDAYNELTYSFLKIPNGTVANTDAQQSINTITHTGSKNFSRSIDFSYPGTTTIFRTTHDAETVPFGEAYTKFTINCPDNPAKSINNALDSININSTSTDTVEISGSVKQYADVPNALDDNNKTAYSGSLSNGTFSLNNFSVVESVNNRNNFYATTADGTEISTKIAPNDEYTTMLGVTDGTSTSRLRGAINIHPNDANTAAYTTLASDVCVSLPKTTQSTSKSNTPKATTYKLSRDGKTHYFGATYSWNYQPGTMYAGYGYFSSQANNQSIDFTVNVVDISSLIDLVAECGALDAKRYTADSWATLETAFDAAKADYDYHGLAYTKIASDLKDRYNALWTARDQLVEKTFTVTFEYKDASGNAVSTPITVDYGKTLNDYKSTIDAIVTPDYVEGHSTYSFTGWDKAIDYTAAVNADAVYTAVYDGVLNLADFTDFNNAKASLLGALTDKTFVTADIQAIADEVSAMKYFAYDKAAQDATYADEQDAVDAQTARLVELKNGLTPSTVTIDAFDAAVAELNHAVDADRFDVSKMDTIGYDTVFVADVKVVTVPFADQAALDKAITAIIESLNNNLKSYSVKLNDIVIPGLESVPYGTAVIVNSDGTYKLNVTDTNENYSGKSVDWSYSYDAPSRGENGFTAPKYIVTAPSFGFIVKGDTNLTSAAVAAEAGDTYVVTVKSSTGKIIDVATTTGSYTMPEAPIYVGWVFDSYSNGAVAGDEINVTANTTIVADYSPVDNVNTYMIDIFATKDDFFGESPTEKLEGVKYNTRIDLVPTDDIFCWVHGALDEDMGVYNYSILSYDPNYSFFACRSYHNENYYCEGVVGLTKAEYDELVINQTLLDENSGIAYLNEESGEFIYDGQNTPILCKVIGESGSYALSEDIVAAPTVTALQKVLPVYDESDNISEFAMIGSFVLPEGYKVLEYGILFTGRQAASELTVQNVGTDSGVYRYKASRYTVGNQFVINMSNPGRNVDFRYRAYAIIQDADGNAVPYYSNICSDNNYSF